MSVKQHFSFHFSLHMEVHPAVEEKKGQTTDDQGKLKRRGRSQLLNNQKGMKCNQEKLN
jgi:hypothetical protein